MAISSGACQSSVQDTEKARETRCTIHATKGAQDTQDTKSCQNTSGCEDSSKKSQPICGRRPACPDELGWCGSEEQRCLLSAISERRSASGVRRARVSRRLMRIAIAFVCSVPA